MIVGGTEMSDAHLKWPQAGAMHRGWACVGIRGPRSGSPYEDYRSRRIEADLEHIKQRVQRSAMEVIIDDWGDASALVTARKSSRGKHPGPKLGPTAVRQLT